MATENSTSDIMNKLNYLDTTKQQIRTALNNKGQSIPSYTPFREYSTIINDMSIGTDTRDATATEYDILAPYTAYVNDQKLTGRILTVANNFSFDNIEISQTNSTSNSLYKDYTMTDSRILHKEYLDGIDLHGKNFIIYRRLTNNESDSIVFTWNNTQTLKITFNNNTMTLKTYNGNTETNSLKTYTDLFLNGEPTITEGSYSMIYFGNDSYYSTANVYDDNDNLIFAQIESLSYTYITIEQSFNTTKAVPAIIKNKVDINQQDLARMLGITPDKIKLGENILGVIGTYEGEISSQEIEQINDNLEEVLGINE